MSHQPSQTRTIPPTFRNANIHICLFALHLHYRSKTTNTLASLVKGEVLSPEKIRATTGGIVTPPTFFKTALSLAQHHVLASPRKRVRFCCSVKPSQLWWGLNLIELLSLKLQSIRSAPTLSKPHYSSKIANTLASLVKGEVLSPEKIRVTTGVIATPLLPKPHYPSPCTTTLASLVKGEVLSPS